VVNGQLEDSLRHEIESYMDGRLNALKQEIATLQSLINESLSSFLERQGDLQIEGSLATSIAEHLRTAHERGIDQAAAESSRAKASSDMAIVKAAIAEINDQHSQADILRTLVNRASSFAPRVAFFVVKGGHASGWRGRGFEGTVGDQSIQQIVLPLTADTVIGSVVNSLDTWSGGPGSHSEDHLLLNRLGDEAAQRIVAIPLKVRSRAVAVIYADSAGLDSESINLEALETLVSVSGMAVELLSASRPAAKRVSEEAPAPPEPQPAYAPSSEYEESAPPAAEPTFSGEDTIETSYQAHPEPATFSDEAPATDFGVEEPAAAVEEVADSGEATPSWKPEPSSVASEAPSAGRRRYGQDVELPVEVSNDEERRLHNDARRFARLLISEIKLYNEQKVVEGRSEYDLYDRLREYIDRSREMYDKRVKPEVASRYDYFHGELVNTLAEGDVSKLGSNYPGATVTA
jgi:hypothetical protein